MRTPRPLPSELGSVFSFAEAQALGVGRRRLAGKDLESPFRAVRASPGASARQGFPVGSEVGVRDAQTLAQAYARRMRPVEFFSHLTAAVLWGAPVNLPAGSPIDVSVYGDAGLPRSRGVRGHRADPRTTTTTEREGLRVASPASAWASLGSLPVESLVMIGDYLCRNGAKASCVRMSDVSRSRLGPRLLSRSALADASERPAFARHSS